MAASMASFGVGLSVAADVEREPSLSSRPPTSATTPRSAARSVTKPAPAELTAPGASAVAPPRFVWAPERGAIGYRVALYRDERLVFERDVKEAELVLPASWTQGKRLHRLTRGAYRWVVWPLFGATKRPGPAIVSASYTV